MQSTKNEIVVYQPNETLRLDVRLEKETVWLNQARIGELFGVDRTVVNRHIHNIYKTGELDEPSTCAKNAQVQKEGGRTITRQIPFYNLDMIIAVGYRVNSFAATQFRKWATTILREYLLRGYAFNQRMNALEDRVDRRMAKTEQDVVELKEKVDFFVQTSQPPVRRSKNFHDRFLIIDDKTLYVFGASLKDLGSKCFAFTKLDASEIPLLKARI